MKKNLLRLLSILVLILLAILIWKYIPTSKLPKIEQSEIVEQKQNMNKEDDQRWKDKLSTLQTQTEAEVEVKVESEEIGIELALFDENDMELKSFTGGFFSTISEEEFTKAIL